jgi:N4-gp56 family major capsid protein
MATGAIGTNHQTVTTGATFIPEIWSDETIAAYKSNLVVANLVTRLNHKGKKGDTINIPTPVRGSATVKAANTAVKIQSDTHNNTAVSINKHYEYSVLIEDITEVQALSSLRKFYTDDAGYALAKQVDTDIVTLWEGLQGGTVAGANAAAWEKAVIGSVGTTLYTGNSSNAADITDAGIRAMILALDNADVPMDNRSLVLPPVAANDLLGINRFTEQQFIGNGDAIRTGKIGQIYGVDVYVSSNCPTTTTGATATDRVGCLMHKDAFALAEQVSVRSQTQYKQEWLGDLFTSDTLYGVAELRNTAGISFVVPGS